MKLHPILITFLVAYVTYNILITGLMYAKDPIILKHYINEAISGLGIFSLLAAIFVGWVAYQSL